MKSAKEIAQELEKDYEAMADYVDIASSPKRVKTLADLAEPYIREAQLSAMEKTFKLCSNLLLRIGFFILGWFILLSLGYLIF